MGVVRPSVKGGHAESRRLENLSGPDEDFFTSRLRRLGIDGRDVVSFLTRWVSVPDTVVHSDAQWTWCTRRRRRRSKNVPLVVPRRKRNSGGSGGSLRPGPRGREKSHDELYCRHPRTVRRHVTGDGRWGGWSVSQGIPTRGSGGRRGTVIGPCPFPSQRK